MSGSYSYLFADIDRAESFILFFFNFLPLFLITISPLMNSPLHCPSYPPCATEYFYDNTKDPKTSAKIDYMHIATLALPAS